MTLCFSDTGDTLSSIPSRSNSRKDKNLFAFGGQLFVAGAAQQVLPTCFSFQNKIHGFLRGGVIFAFHDHRQTAYCYV